VLSFSSTMFGWQANNNRIACALPRGGSFRAAPFTCPHFFWAGVVLRFETRMGFLEKHDVALTEPQLEEVCRGPKAPSRGRQGQDWGKLGSAGGRDALPAWGAGTAGSLGGVPPFQGISSRRQPGASTSAPGVLLLAQGDPIFSGELREQTESLIKSSGVPFEVHESEGVKARVHCALRPQ